MYHPSLSELQSLAGRGNLVPVYRELPADLETPVSVYLKLRGLGPSFLLESVEGGEQVGRYSFLGVNPALILTARDGQVSGGRNGEQELFEASDPLEAVKQVLSRYRIVAVPGLPRFVGGAVGTMSYDLVRYFERLPANARNDLGLPVCQFLVTDTLVAFDHARHRLLIITCASLDGDLARDYAVACSKIDAIVARLRQPLTLPGAPAWHIADELRSNLSQADFEGMVRQAQEYIAAGDIFQVVLSQRFERRTAAEPFSIYRALRMLNPSPYMVFLDLGDTQLIASSPEMHVRLDGGTAEMRPIAGTRRRGASEAEDQALAQELLADPKERAEHVMLVDLGRNDLGRVCEYGSVHVPELMTVERYSHVMHIVSSVRGRLRSDLDAFDLLRATFPAGTVSGAPKVRAMEIIEQLEGVRRGPYAGAIGYFGYDGNMDSCITIRTIVMRGQTAYIQAGAGIVADSDPAREYEETVNKARALAEAIRIAERGLLGG
jgi:anthranilate synthase component 1